MANLRNIQFLRNSSIYESLSAATAALTTQASGKLDGSPLVGRYTVDGEERSVLGIVHVSGETTGVTFFNNAKEIDSVLDGLDYGPIGGTDASVLTQIQQVDGRISGLTANVGSLKLTDYAKGSDSGNVAATDSINAAVAKLENQIDAANDKVDALDASSVSGESNVVIDVTQEDGQITATAANLTGVKLDGYAVGSDAKIAAADTLGEALGKIQGQINAMDLTDTAVEGQYVSKVDEADGKISVTRVALPTVAAISENGKPITAVSESLGTISASAGTIEAQYVTTATANTDFTGVTVQNALEEIASKVKANAITSADKTVTVSSAATGTDIAVNIDGTTIIKNGTTGVLTADLKIQKITQAADSTYAAEYQLVYGNSNTPIGDKIQVGKDQFLKAANYDPTTQMLKLTMWNASGGTTDIEVDFSEAVIESEAGEGLYMKDDHSLNVGIASSSETVTISDGQGGSTQAAVLSVNADNIEVQNIQNAIDYKVSTLDATVGSTTIANDKHVAVQVVEADGVLTSLTVTEDDIASASALTQEITDRQTADTELSNRLGTGVTTANTATAQLTALSGNNESLSGETSVEGAKRYADAILANSVAGLDADVSGNSTHVTVNVVEEDGVVTDVNVAEDNIANADDLADLSGKTVTAITSANGSITANIDDAAGNKTYNIETTAGQISGLTAYASADKGAAKISGVAASDSVQTAVDNLYKSIASEIDARKAAIAARTISGDNAISVTEIANGDGFGTQISLVLDDSTQGNGDERTGNYNALSVTNDGLFLSTTWECGTF